MITLNINIMCTLGKPVTLAQLHRNLLWVRNIFLHGDKEPSPSLCWVVQLSWEHIFFLFLFFFFFAFLELQTWHMEVPRLGVKLEQKLPAYTTATVMWNLRHLSDLHHTSQQCWILNPMSEARDQTCILTDTSWVCYC